MSIQTKVPFSGCGFIDGAGWTVEPELHLENQLCLALYNATNSLTRAYTSAIKPFGMTYPQLLCMMALWQKSPRTVTEIARALDLGKPTITPLLSRLEAQGLVTRTRDDVDERRVNVRLSESGRAIRQPIMMARREMICDLAVAESEIVSLKLRLNHLHRALAIVA